MNLALSQEPGYVNALQQCKHISNYVHYCTYVLYAPDQARKMTGTTKLANQTAVTKELEVFRKTVDPQPDVTCYTDY